MKPKVTLGKKLQLNKQLVTKLQEKQMAHILGGQSDVASSTGASCSCRDVSCGTKAAP